MSFCFTALDGIVERRVIAYVVFPWEKKKSSKEQPWEQALSGQLWCIPGLIHALNITNDVDRAM